jgi:anaerobic selenocysteine-containing dehydrogenase
MLLAVRRLKHVINSTGTQIASLVARAANPCFVHPRDLTRLGLIEGDEIVVTSAHGSVRSIARTDDTLRPGVVSLTHGFGGPAADGGSIGANTNALLSATENLQAISAMPLLTAVPVTLAAATVLAEA